MKNRHNCSMNGNDILYCTRPSVSILDLKTEQKLLKNRTYKMW